MIKKSLATLVIAVLFLVPFTVHAAPVGNIARPSILKSVAGTENRELSIIGEGEFDFTFDTKIKDSDGDSEYSFWGGKLGVVFQDKYIVYGLLGAAKFEEAFTSSGSKVEIESEVDLTWGIGATLLLYETVLTDFNNCTLRFGTDAKYRSSEIDVDKVIIDGTSYDLPSGDVTSIALEYSDWQVAAEVSLQWNQFVPYLGVKYSDLDATTKATISGTEYSDSDIERDSNFGVFLGTDVIIADSVALNVEGRFIDEEALSLGCAVKF